MILADEIDQIFSALNKNIILNNGKKIEIVVCGGTALFVMGLINRTTKDVDVLGLVINKGKKKEIAYIEKFPEWFIRSANTVAKDFNLPENWINLGPASQVKSGLPDGFVNRLTKKVYGKQLIIHFISRLDQVYFKLYASIDRGGYHVDDLFALNPTPKEILNASEWVLTQDVSEGFRLILKDFLKKYNYEEIAERV